MKQFTKSILSLLGVAAVCLGVSSCGDKEDIAGSWTGNQERIDNVTGASDAFSSVTMTFENDTDGDSGMVTLSAIISANQPVLEDSTMVRPYEISVAATATVSGKWSYEKGEDDDIIISLDPSTFVINVDPDGVAFSENMLTGRQQPEVDSLTAVTAKMWQNNLAPAMKDVFNRYTRISDIEIHNGILRCEIGHKDLNFRKVGY